MSTSCSSNEDTRCSINGITGGCDAMTASSNSLRFNYPHKTSGGGMTPGVGGTSTASTQIGQSFSSSIVNLFESKENSSIAGNFMISAPDDDMLMITANDSQNKPFSASSHMASFRLSAPNGC
jgi:hypothetical protein